MCEGKMQLLSTLLKILDHVQYNPQKSFLFDIAKIKKKFFVISKTFVKVVFRSISE